MRLVLRAVIFSFVFILDPGLDLISVIAFSGSIEALRELVLEIIVPDTIADLSACIYPLRIPFVEGDRLAGRDMHTQTPVRATAIDAHEHAQVY